MPFDQPQATRRWSDYQKGSKTAAISFDVVGARTGDAAFAACNLQRNSQHFEDSALKVDDWSISQPGLQFYRVTFSFSIPDDGNEHPATTTSGTNPLTLPPTIKWDVGSATEPIDRTINNKPIVNSALDAFDPPIQRLFPTIFLTYTRYESAPFAISKYLPYVATVNKQALTIPGSGTIKEGQMLCHSITPVAEYTPDAKYIQVSYNFELREDGFEPRILDQGFRAWAQNPDPGVIEIFDQTGAQITQQVRLNGKGKPMDTSLSGQNAETFINCPSGVDATTDVTEDAVFLKFKIYKETDFAALGL